MNGLTRAEARKVKRAAAEALATPPVRRRVHRDGVNQVLVDPELFDKLMEIAHTSLKLLDCTERGGAGACFPHEFTLLVTNLRNLETLLQSEKGAGPLVADLLTLLDSFDFED